MHVKMQRGSACKQREQRGKRRGGEGEEELPLQRAAVDDLRCLALAFVPAKATD